MENRLHWQTSSGIFLELVANPCSTRNDSGAQRSLELPPESETVDHRLPHCWPLTLSLLTVDHQSASLLTVDTLTVDCWSSPSGSTVTVLICWSLSLLTVDPPHCWLLIINRLTVDSLIPLTVDCWYPPGSTVNSVDHRSPLCWPSTLSLLTVDHWLPHCWLLTLPHRINSQQCWLLITSLLTVDPLTVDCRPPYRFQLCQSLIYWCPLIQSHQLGIPLLTGMVPAGSIRTGDSPFQKIRIFREGVFDTLGETLRSRGFNL